MTHPVDSMAIAEQSRWMALIEAIDLISSECEERGLNFDTINLEPIYLRKYMDKESDRLNLIIQEGVSTRHKQNRLLQTE